MSIIAAKSWLPAELTIVQPYSMSPVLGCRASHCAGMWVAPATGTCVGMDRPELMISSVFVAPMAVQRQAQKEGVRGIVMRRVPGLLEALGLVPEGAQEQAPVVTRTEKPGWVPPTFAEALAALEDEEED
jgi:hypothetical protein